MIDQKSLNEVFPKNPLREVAFEVRFPLNLRILPDIYLVQQQLKSEFPIVNREEGISANGKVVTTFHFLQQKEEYTIRVLEDRWAIICLAYKTFEAFKSEVTGWSYSFCREFQIDQVSRIGLRYVNHIPVLSSDSDDDALRKVEALVKPNIQPKSQSDGQVTQFGTQLLTQKKDRALAVRTLYNQQLNDGAYILDLDCFVEQPQKLEDLNKILDLLHHDIQVEFLEHVTEGYKQQMRGKP